jgi:hypothetical protein
MYPKLREQTFAFTVAIVFLASLSLVRYACGSIQVDALPSLPTNIFAFSAMDNPIPTINGRPAMIRWSVGRPSRPIYK